LLAKAIGSEEASARDEACLFLETELASGPLLTAKLKKTATDAGLAWRTIERAKPRIGAKAKKGMEGWEWAQSNGDVRTGGGVLKPGGLGGVGGLDHSKKVFLKGLYGGVGGVKG
jgi:hypothetical protein